MRMATTSQTSCDENGRFMAAENVKDLQTPVRELYASGKSRVAVRVRLVIGLVV